MRKVFFFIAAAVLTVCGSVSSVASKGGGAADASERREKARYYFLEGAEASAQDNIGEAYALFKKAYDTDPSYYEAAYAYGSYQMYLVPSDGSPEAQQKWEDVVNLRRRMIDAYPSDQALVRLYAQQLMNDPGRTLNGQPVAREAVRVLERLDSLGSPSPYHLLQLSGAYSALEMPDSVLGALSRYERREGSSPELLENKIGLLFQSGATDRAVKEIDEYRATHPRDEYPLILMAMLKYSEEDVDSTFHYLREAERLNPNSFEVKSRIGMLGLEHGDTALYRSKILEALELPDGEYEGKSELVKRYLDLSDFRENKEELAKVREIFTSLHGQFPQDSELYLIEGAAEASAGNNETGLELIRRSVSLNPESERGRGVLIQALLRDDDKNGALEELKKAWSEIGPLQSMRSLAVFLSLEEEDTTQALSFIETSLHDISPDISLTEPIDLSASIFRNLNYNRFVDLASIFQEAGDVYQKMGDSNKMVKSYENALTLTPNSPLALNNYAYYLALAGVSLDRALEMADRAVMLDPGNPTYTDTRAWVLYKRGDLEEAEKAMAETISIYDKAIEENPDATEEIESEMGEALSHYAEILEKLGRTEESMQVRQRIKK